MLAGVGEMTAKRELINTHYKATQAGRYSRQMGNSINYRPAMSSLDLVQPFIAGWNVQDKLIKNVPVSGAVVASRVQKNQSESKNIVVHQDPNYKQIKVQISEQTYESIHRVKNVLRCHPRCVVEIAIDLIAPLIPEIEEMGEHWETLEK